MSESSRNSGNDQASPRELTVTALLLGVVLSVVMGAANVYLGLRAGMTVSASIPAAVVAMGILRAMGRRSVLESNMVQTGASAGESLAAGIIFTIPALVLVGIWKTFDYWTTTLIAFGGGLLGILFMIPMRRVFVVESPELHFPEGVACAEVLRAGAGERPEGAGDATGTGLVVGGLLLGAVFKFAGSFLGLIKGSVEWAAYQGSRVFYFGCDISPALVAVGVIVGLPIAVQIFLGGAIGWLVMIPLLGADAAGGPALDAASALWRTQVRYAGVGAMVVGGIVSIWRVRAGLAAAAGTMMSRFGPQEEEKPNATTPEDISGTAILWLALLAVVVIVGVYHSMLQGAVAITLLTTAIMLVMAFFFTAVASYIVGLVGNSNSPVSGMTITTILVTGLLITAFGYSGTAGMAAMLGVAGVVCCVACTSGDVCNDLKTGYLVGASPRKQQIIQVLGVLAASFIMAPVMVVLHEGSIKQGTGGIGGEELPAPQAKLFEALAQGFFGTETLPWTMVGIGAAIGVVLVALDVPLARAGSKFRLHVMPVAVGMYLPFGLAVPIVIGGIFSALIARRARRAGQGAAQRGVLVASGVIAGESLVGVLLGTLAYMNVASLDWGAQLGGVALDLISVAALAAVCVWVWRRSA